MEVDKFTSIVLRKTIEDFPYDYILIKIRERNYNWSDERRFGEYVKPLKTSWIKENIDSIEIYIEFLEELPYNKYGIAGVWIKLTDGIYEIITTGFLEIFEKYYNLLEGL